METLENTMSPRLRSESTSTLYSTVSSATCNSSKPSSFQSHSDEREAKKPKRSLRNVARTIMLAGIFVRQTEKQSNESKEKFSPCHYSWHRDYYSTDNSVPEFERKERENERVHALTELRQNTLRKVPAVSDDMQKVIFDLGKTHLFPELTSCESPNEESSVKTGKKYKRGNGKGKELKISVKKTVINPNRFIQNTQEAVKYSKRDRTFSQSSHNVVKQQNALKAWQSHGQDTPRTEIEYPIHRVGIENGVSSSASEVGRARGRGRLFEAWSSNDVSKIGSSSSDELIEKYLSGSMFFKRDLRIDTELLKRTEDTGQRSARDREYSNSRQWSTTSLPRTPASPSAWEIRRHRQLSRSRTLSCESEKLVYGLNNSKMPTRSGNNTPPKKKLLRTRTLSTDSERSVFSASTRMNEFDEVEVTTLDVLPGKKTPPKPSQLQKGLALPNESLLDSKSHEHRYNVHSEGLPKL